jgi:hypothetical protein
MDCPGEYLSLDEGLVRCSSFMNPIYTTLKKAKPLEGFMVWLLVNFQTKVIVGMVPNFKQYMAENSVGFIG